jgi:DNA-binding LacI/PurR family transcriptional regulator
VAALAGVSKSTVSHTFSGKRPISAETRQRVLNAASELGYRPDPVAQRLARGQSQRTIGFAFPLFSPTIAGLEMQFIASAANVANQADHSFVLLTHPHQQSARLERFVNSALIDGFVLMQVYLHDARVEALRERQVPFVLVGRCLDNGGLAYVDADVEDGMRQCVDHLVALGHRTIGYLHQDDADFGFAVRARCGFEAACQAQNVTGVLQPCGFSPESGVKAAKLAMAQDPQTTALIVWNDAAVWGVLQAADELGLRIPRSLSLITFNYSATTRLLPFEPTMVDIQAGEVARLATHMIIDLLAGRFLERTQVLIKTQFVLGNSTAPAP